MLAQHSYSLFPLYNLARITDRKLRGACTSGSIDALNAPLPAALCVVDIAAVETDRHRQRRLASLLPPVFLCRRVDGGSCRSTVTPLVSFTFILTPVGTRWKRIYRIIYIYISLSIFTISLKMFSAELICNVEKWKRYFNCVI